MMFTGSTIAAATGGALRADGPAGQIQTDTRKLQGGAWYVALGGERFDGHAFLPQAAAAGCAGAIVQTPPADWDRGLVVVPDTLTALQDLGRAARRSFTGPVVAITGSVGKTSTRVMIVEVLRALGVVHHTQGNLNNHIGLPLTLTATPPDAEVMVLELGMNHLGEIRLLQEICAPTVRVITNVGPVHVEGCGSVAGVAAAKQELFDGARPGDVVCVNQDDPWIAAMPVPEGARVVRFGHAPSADVRITSVAVDGLSTRIRVETASGPIDVQLPVPGAHFAENVGAAVAVGLALGVPAAQIGPAFARFAPEGMRNRVEHLSGALILNDAYNANPLSMRAALRTLTALGVARPVAALGDMLELGSYTEAGHIEVLTLARSLGVETHVTGPLMTAAAASVPGIWTHPDVGALTAALTLGPDSALLVKGSRSTRMERVLELLRAQKTETTCSST